jgi:chemotaxis protein methyltransferase WspC
MGFESLQQLLKERIGLDAASIGISAIERAARLRQATTGVAGTDDYIELVQSSSDELTELIDAVVVGETWFFRDAGAFAALADLARQECAKRAAGASLRLLSLPCSTGEEPYTMAMALLDAGLPPPQFHVDAVDVSERLLARARNGTYGRSSFRGADVEFRERHFDAVPGGHRIRDRVRQQVTFRQGNLIALDPAAAERYDFVFCRNVLIYFDAATQDLALRNVASLLKPEAYLFVGAAETGLLWERDFRSTRAGAAFVFQKGKQLRAVAPLPAARLAPARVVPPRAAAATQRPRLAAAPPPALPAVGPGDLEEARRRADEGHFVEAARLCEQHMREKGADAEAYYLLGLVRDASGNAADAAVHYRKALYLDPHHGEALLHLALLLDLEGQTSAAQALRDRARRTAMSRNA